MYDDVYVLYTFRITNVELLMLSTHVFLQMSKLTKSFYRTRGIRTVSPSCEYACAVSNHQMYEKLYRTHHMHAVSRSCEYACGFAKH